MNVIAIIIEGGEEIKVVSDPHKSNHVCASQHKPNLENIPARLLPNPRKTDEPSGE